MLFKIVNVYTKDKKDLITGYFLTQDEDERAVLKIMCEVFGDLPVYSDKFKCNGKNLLFKSVEIELLKNNLSLISESLGITMRFALGKNFIGDRTMLAKHAIAVK